MVLTIPEREVAGKRGPRQSGGRRVASVDVDPRASSGAKEHGDTLVRGHLVTVRVLKLLGSDLEHGAGDGIALAPGERDDRMVSLAARRDHLRVLDLHH